MTSEKATIRRRRSSQGIVRQVRPAQKLEERTAQDEREVLLFMEGTRIVT